MDKNVLLATVAVFALSAGGVACAGDEANKNDFNGGSVIGQDNAFNDAIGGSQNGNIFSKVIGGGWLEIGDEGAAAQNGHKSASSGNNGVSLLSVSALTANVSNNNVELEAAADNKFEYEIDVKSEGRAAASAAASSSAAAGHFTTGDIGGFGTTNTGGINNIQVTTGFNNVRQNSVSIAAQGPFNVPLPPSGGGDEQDADCSASVDFGPLTSFSRVAFICDHRHSNSNPSGVITSRRTGTLENEQQQAMDPRDGRFSRP